MQSYYRKIKRLIINIAKQHKGMISKDKLTLIMIIYHNALKLKTFLSIINHEHFVQPTKKLLMINGE